MARRLVRNIQDEAINRGRQRIQRRETPGRRKDSAAPLCKCQTDRESVAPLVMSVLVGLIPSCKSSAPGRSYSSRHCSLMTVTKARRTRFRLRTPQSLERQEDLTSGCCFADKELARDQDAKCPLVGDVGLTASPPLQRGRLRSGVSAKMADPTNPLRPLHSDLHVVHIGP